MNENEDKKYIRELRRSIARNWWENLTPEEKAAHAARVSAGKKARVKKVAPGKAKGESHYRSKLTEALVREIHKSPLSSRKVSEKYGISISVVQNIWRGTAWKHLGLGRSTRPDLRVKDEIAAANPAEPLLTNDQKEEISANPWMDTRELAKQLGVHWMVVATFRQRQMRRGSW